MFDFNAVDKSKLLMGG